MLNSLMAIAEMIGLKRNNEKGYKGKMLTGKGRHVPSCD
jgi:hypothetical protein